ncbi:MAG: MlaE family lipid ABC transporter permease subunit [Methylovulum sp.]|nr:MAG: MlaE family lipid ABC transporter permease subunit [Methylovulum sp.]
MNTDTQTNQDRPPLLELIEQDDGQCYAKLSGNWNLRNIAIAPDLQKKISRIAAGRDLQWDMRPVNVLDSASALMLWQAWGERLPARLWLRPEHQGLFERWQSQQLPAPERVDALSTLSISRLNQLISGIFERLSGFVVILGRLVLDGAYLLAHPREVPWLEMSSAIYDAGVRALGITALVGFLIGIVLSYLSALELKMFGAEIYIINILGLSIIRELGPLLAAILVAGRSGSAMTAQIGIMRVTEELDALSAMGISHSIRLTLPKVAALTVAMPLLSVWTSALALIGGMFSAQNTLDINYQQFLSQLPDAVPLINILIALGKSAVFGLVIALIACYFGFRIKPNTESLGNETTNSVVVSITMVIMNDAVFAILFMDVGMP